MIEFKDKGNGQYSLSAPRWVVISLAVLSVGAIHSDFFKAMFLIFSTIVVANFFISYRSMRKNLNLLKEVRELDASEAFSDPEVEWKRDREMFISFLTFSRSYLFLLSYRLTEILNNLDPLYKRTTLPRAIEVGNKTVRIIPTGKTLVSQGERFEIEFMKNGERINGNCPFSLAELKALRNEMGKYVEEVREHWYGGSL